jgi:hypothetical protein
VPLRAGAGGAADAVDVDLGVFGQVVVDDVGDALHVQAAGGEVRRDEHLQFAAPQLLHDAVALALVQVAVDLVGSDALVAQVVGQPADGLTLVRQNTTVSAGSSFVQQCTSRRRLSFGWTGSTSA